MRKYFIIFLLLGACATNKQQHVAQEAQLSKRDSFKLNVLKLGMPEAEVRAALGKPDVDDTENGVTNIQYFNDFIPLTIAFMNGKVVAYKTMDALMEQRAKQRRAQYYSNDNYMGSVVGNALNQLGNDMQNAYAPKRTTDCHRTALGVTCVDR